MSVASYLIGDVFDVLATMPDDSVDLVLTSPPFLALRSYLPADHPDKHKEIGSEPTPAEFLDTLLALTAEWGRVLAPHGSIAVELGDTYSGSGGAGGDYSPDGLRAGQGKFEGSNSKRGKVLDHDSGRRTPGPGWPLDKSLCGIPHLYHLSLAYGRNLLTGQPSPAGQWRVRNVVAWCRPNPPVGALGDKFRPATSYMTIATRARDRWFDLDAVRTEAKYPDEHRSAEGPQQYEGDGNPRQTLRSANPAGAPPLDWWQVSTEPYSGSHYATWPRKLLDRPIKAMCPIHVCETCGEPRRRIVGDPIYVTANGDEHPGDEEWRHGRGGDIAGMGSTAPTSLTRQADTVGWTDCGHGSWACRSCKVVVPYGDALRRSREAQAGEPGVSAQGVLAEPVEGSSESQDDPRNMRGVRDRVSGTLGSEMLFPELRSETGALRGQDEQHRRHGTHSSQVAGRSEGEPQRLRDGVGAAHHAGSAQERLHDGAQAGDAEPPRATAGVVGDRPSPQRGEGRQPDRESGSGDEGATRRNGDVSALPGDVPGQLSWSCPHCGCSELAYIEDHWRNGIVLDPFAGSGTTLAVATGHGRDAIGIDLDERNAHLAQERIGMFLTVTDTRSVTA